MTSKRVISSARQRATRAFASVATVGGRPKASARKRFANHRDTRSRRIVPLCVYLSI